MGTTIFGVLMGARQLDARWLCRLFVAGAVVLAGCTDGQTESADTGVIDAAQQDAGQQDVSPSDSTVSGRQCTDLHTLEVCESGSCEQRSCRGDQICQQATCVDWVEADLSVDFTIETDSQAPLGIEVQVDEGGFPRAHVEALRFSFGDGVGGWGEQVGHVYAEPGVYLVELTVRLTGHRVLRATKLAAVAVPDDHNPLELTVNDIPAYLNGSVPAPVDPATPDDPSDDTTEPFMLQVPRSQFVIDIALLEAPTHPVELDSLSLTADVPMGDRPAGSELVELLDFDDGEHLKAPRAQLAVGPDHAAPQGVVTLTLSAQTSDGQTHQRSLQVEAVELPTQRAPFDRPMTWLFRTDRDFFTAEKAPRGGQRFEISATQTPNGEPDLAEELRVMGAQGPDEALNQIYLEWVQQAITTEVYRYFGIGPDGLAHDDIELTIAWQGAPGAPSPQDFDPDGEFSMMRFGGRFDGFVGYSKISWYNEKRVDDSTVEYGIATAGILSALTSAPGITAAFDPITTTPVGTHPADPTVLEPDFDPYGDHAPEVSARYAKLRQVARYIALGLAPVIAHEMGHAMGLVPGGLPPQGFFAGRGDVTFVDRARTGPHHVDLPGLNLMQAGGDYLGLINKLNSSTELPQTRIIELAELLSLETRLSPLSRAYLQGRLTYETPAPNAVVH
jgi:hypothetical protein